MLSAVSINRIVKLAQRKLSLNEIMFFTEYHRIKIYRRMYSRIPQKNSGKTTAFLQRKFTNEKVIQDNKTNKARNYLNCYMFRPCRPSSFWRKTIKVYYYYYHYHHHHPVYARYLYLFLRQTMSLGNTVLQLFCCYYLWCLYR